MRTCMHIFIIHMYIHQVLAVLLFCNIFVFSLPQVFNYLFLVSIAVIYTSILCFFYIFFTFPSTENRLFLQSYVICKCIITKNTYSIMSGSSFSLPQPRTFDILLFCLSNNSTVTSAAKLPLFLLLVKRFTSFLDPSSSWSEPVLTCVGHTIINYSKHIGQFVHIQLYCENVL